MQNHNNIAGGFQKIQMFFKLYNTIYPDISFKIEVFLDDISLDGTNSKMGDEITFDKIFSMNYTFEKEQYLKLIVKSPEDNSIKFEANLTIGRIMGTRNFSLKHKLVESEGENEGLILQIDAKNAIETKMASKLKLNATFSNPNLLKDFDINEIFYVIQNFIDQKNFRSVYKSEEKNFRSMQFDELLISRDLLYEKENDEIMIKLYDANLTEISEILIPIKDLKFANSNNNNNSVIRKEFFDKNGKIMDPLGDLNIFYSEYTKKTFVDYLYSGMEINLSIGIDFTASNGSPREKGSLHSFLLNEPNDYERAISSCGQILSYYDTDKIYPVFGFGAQFIGSNIVNHCFNVSFNNDPNIQGMDNVINTYRENVLKLNFSGPTYFSPLIKNVCDIIKMNLNMNPQEVTYNILLILSDGQINDMSQTCDILVEAAKLPLSVIIVGIGNADFSNMVTLGNIFNFFFFINFFMRFFALKFFN